MTDPSAAGHDPAWKRRAVERSLGTARARALDRSVAFLAAATELFAETGRIDFTVQDIVDRSGLSLRAFYVHFASKDDLLLALFEEMIAQFAAELRAEVEEEHDALAQLRRYVQGFIGRVESSRGSGGRALGAYHLRLADERPADLAAALAPQVVLLAEIVDRGVAQGRFRTDLDGDALTMLLDDHAHVDRRDGCARRPRHRYSRRRRAGVGVVRAGRPGLTPTRRAPR